MKLGLFLGRLCLFAAIASVLGGATALAQNEVDNGASGVYCDGNPPRVQLLDFYEAPLYGDIIDLGDAALTVAAKIELALARLHRVDPVRAARYRAEATAFLAGETAIFRPGIALTPVDDAYPRELPAGCALQNLAKFRRPPLPTDKIYLVDADLWTLLSHDDRAGLVLHELVYNEAAWHLGHTNSVRVRRFVSLLASTGFDSLSQDEYRQVMHALGLDGFDLTRGIKFSFGSVTLRDDGSLASGQLRAAERVDVCPRTPARNVAPRFRGGALLLFHGNGVVQSGVTDAAMAHAVAGGTIWLKSRIAFHPNCQIAAGLYGDPATIQVLGDDGQLKQVRQNDYVIFDADGRLRRVDRAR